MGLEPASVRLLTLSNIEISKTSGPIAIKIYMKPSIIGVRAALGFGPHRIGTLISMATDSSHRAKMGEHLVSTLALSVFIGSSLFLQVHVRRTTIIP